MFQRLPGLTTIVSLLAIVGVTGPGLAQTVQDCAWTTDGTAPPLDAGQCTADPEKCATQINQCLLKFDFQKNSEAGKAWYLFTSDKGLEQSVTQPRHINHQTPQHGRWLAVYVNQIAKDALDAVMADPPSGQIRLPAGSVIAKLNYDDKIKAPEQQWLTVMTKIDGYCSAQQRATLGGNCNGGDWFYYLSRFGKFLSFEEVVGVSPDGTPIEGGRVAAYGQPSSFCTGCHNPVERTDYLWTLDASLWKTEPLVIEAPSPNLGTSQPADADLCKDGTITLSAKLPSDVPVNPANVANKDAVQSMFDCFSWKTFVALNWAADPAMRGQPDTSKPFTDTRGPRVWESYKETFEVFQPTDPDWKVTPADWNTSPDVPAACQQVLEGLDAETRDSLREPKFLQMTAKNRGGQVLNETHQAFGNQFNILIDQNQRLVRYEVRFNRDEFQYLAENGYANTGNYTYSGPTDGSIVQFPTNANGATGAGSIEIKAAWREICEPEGCTDAEREEAKRYYTTPALRFIPSADGGPGQCTYLPAVGLIGLHVIRKTETAPQWIWSTFEHIDNVPPAGENPVEGKYTLYAPHCAKPDNQPTPALCRSLRPGVLPNGKLQSLNIDVNKAQCCANLQLLGNADPRPAGGAIATGPLPQLLKNHVTRLDPVGPVAINKAYHKALTKSPFQNYVLINTQWPQAPRDTSGNIRRRSCEQLGMVGRDSDDCYTIQPRKASGSIRLRNTSMETFQVSINDGKDGKYFSSAGCINCHGDAGVDFSFVFTDGLEILTPHGGN